MSRDETKTSTYFSPQADRERAKELAQKRRAEQRSRKRACSVCGITEDDRTPFIPHPDGIGPICSNNPRCLPKRSSRITAVDADWKR